MFFYENPECCTSTRYSNEKCTTVDRERELKTTTSQLQNVDSTTVLQPLLFVHYTPRFTSSLSLYLYLSLIRRLSYDLMLDSFNGKTWVQRSLSFLLENFSCQPFFPFFTTLLGLDHAEKDSINIFQSFEMISKSERMVSHIFPQKILSFEFVVHLPHIHTGQFVL